MGLQMVQTKVNKEEAGFPPGAGKAADPSGASAESPTGHRLGREQVWELPWSFPRVSGMRGCSQSGLWGGGAHCPLSLPSLPPHLHSAFLCWPGAPCSWSNRASFSLFLPDRVLRQRSTHTPCLGLGHLFVLAGG